jgi:uracil-DNA glycosylase family 4
MPVSGKGKKNVLILGEGPGKNEDKRGIQFCGTAGETLIKLLQSINIRMRRDCRITNAVICHPKDKHGNNRKPTAKEIGFCLPNLQKTIQQYQPTVIIPMGGPAIQAINKIAWKPDFKLQGKGGVGNWTGWKIPSVKLNAWICPTYHPSFLSRSEGEGEEESRSPALELHMHRHLKAAFKKRFHRPWRDGFHPEYERAIKVLNDTDHAAEQVRIWMEEGKPLAFDYETTCKKPDGRYAEILCCSVSDGERSIAFPWVGRVIGAMKRLITSGVPLIAANLSFENRWSMKFLGAEVKKFYWDCVAGSHWQDCRVGVNGVKFQTYVQLGVADYDYLIDPFKTAEDDDGNAPNRLKEVDLQELMKYNALDSLFEWILTVKQRVKLN